MREFRRAGERYRTDGDGVTTWHSFSYGAHYDPENVAFGPLIAVNLEELAPGAGYELHQHSDVEIVTWVLEGALRHEDSTGAGGVIEPGTAQRLSAGSGVRHTERNASDTQRLRFVQMMLVSDHPDAPEYAQAQVACEPGQLTGTVEVHAPAELFAVRLQAGDRVTVPAAPRSVVLVLDGALRLDDTEIGAGEEARLSDAGAYDLSAPAAADALVWQLQR